MSIERLLKEDYGRTRTPDPARTAAYDGFLRRRARYARRVVAATSLAIAAAVALAVSVPRVLADRDDVANLPKGQVLSRPALGYDLAVPARWRVVGDTYEGLLLQPVPGAPGSAPPSLPTSTAPPSTHPSGGPTLAPPATRRPLQPNAQITVAPMILDPRFHPGHAAGTPTDRLPEGPQLNGGPGAQRLQGRFDPGRRPDGRAYLHRATATLSTAPGETYYIAWPYHCAAGVRCPAALRYRALRVTGSVWQGDGAALQAVRDAARWIVDTVRPTTNALPGGATTNRPACRLSPPTDPSAFPPAGRPRGAAPDGGSPRIGVSQMVEGTVGGAADFFMTFSSDHLAMCHLRKRFTVELLQDGRLAAVQGNAAVVTLDGDLPEGDGEFPTLSRAWLWRNWCGGPNATVTIRFRGLDGQDVDAKTVSIVRPRCVDPGKPSTLESTSLPIKVNG